MTNGIEKLATGLDGLDAMTHGGLPRHRATLVAGDAGTGKTVLAMQVLANGARAGRPGAFVSFEESPDELLQNAASFAWAPTELRDVGLWFFDGRASAQAVAAGDFDLSGLLAGLDHLIDEAGIVWAAFDGLDELLALLPNETRRRQELHRISAWLTERALAGLITVKGDAGAWLASEPYAFMKFGVQCVLGLSKEMGAGALTRVIQLHKYRGSAGMTGRYPYVIDEGGIAIAPTRDARLTHSVSRERVTSGVERLDTVIGGGYLRGSATLISGAPGTAKTTLAAAFAAATAQRGERVLYVALDESFEQIVANVASVGLDLVGAVEAGRARGLSLHALSVAPEDHYVAIRKELDTFAPHALVVDPVSALNKQVADGRPRWVAEMLIDRAKSLGVTTLMTSLIDDVGAQAEETESAVSTIADTWMTLAYAVNRGERNRTLSVVKSRGTNHSNQVRELVLSDTGVTLADVYHLGGEVLMGTARMAHERDVAAQERRERKASERRRRARDAEIAEVESKIVALQSQLELKRAERDSDQTEERRREEEAEARAAHIKTSRRGD